jgi:hypothetical protein
VKNFINFVKNQCLDHYIDFWLSPDASVRFERTECNGYFDGDRRQLFVATGKSESIWHNTLVHEYGHMTQWIDKCDEWVNLYVGDRLTAERIVDLWLSHEIELTYEQVDKYVGLSRAVEVNCEHRSVALIQQFGLPINIEDYCRRANAYMYFWTAIKSFREWYVIGREPYCLPEVLELMPTELKTAEEYENIPAEIFNALKGCVNGS